jgi:hypothetical protein
MIKSAKRAQLVRSRLSGRAEDVSFLAGLKFGEGETPSGPEARRPVGLTKPTLAPAQRILGRIRSTSSPPSKLGVPCQNPINPSATRIRQNRSLSKGGKSSKGGWPPFAYFSSLRTAARIVGPTEGRRTVRREARLPSRPFASLRRPDGFRARREACDSKGGSPPFGTIGRPSKGGRIVAVRGLAPGPPRMRICRLAPSLRIMLSRWHPPCEAKANALESGGNLPT